jgi:hypothetical protein
MTEDDMRRALMQASVADRLCHVMHGEREVIVVGLDSSKGVGILFPGNVEVPLAELREGFE